MNLPNIEKASDLGIEEKETLESLLNLKSTVSARNAGLLAYYEGDIKPKDIGIATIPDSVYVDVNCDWPRKAVTSVAERTRFDGYVFDNQYTDEGLERVIQDNNLVSSYNLNIPGELTIGCMFGTVGRYNDTTQIRFHTSETAWAEWDTAAGRIGSGFVIADWKRTSWSRQKAVPVQVNLHLPGEVVEIRRDGQARWTSTTYQTPLDRPMMEAFAFRPTGTKPFGVSRITKTVQTISDEYMRVLQNMAVSGALYAAPQKYVLGLTDEMYDKIEKDKWSTYIGSVFLATAGADDEIPTFGQLPSNSPQPYIDEIMTLAKLFSGATGVPLNSLGIVQDNPSSAEAIQMAREDICIAAEDLIASNKVGLRNIALMSMAVEGNCSIDNLTDEQKSVSAHFKDPSMPSIVSQADATVKIAAAAPWYASSEVFLEKLGFDEAERKRLMSDKAKYEAQNMLAQALTSQTAQADAEGKTEASPPPNNSESTMSKLNGAQTQSLITIMGQYSSGAITEGQATKLIATAVGMTNEDARKILNGVID